MNARKKRLLCRFQDMKCESCHKEFKLNELQIHRIRRGNMGGTYKDHRNLKVLCSNCHKLIHSEEEGISGR